MFGKHIRLKRFLGGIVVLAAMAVAAAPSAFASTSSRIGSEGSAPDALARFLVNHSEAQQGLGTGPYIGTLPAGYTLGGSGHPVKAQPTQGYRFVTDTLGGTRHPVAAQQVQSNRFTSDGFASGSVGIPVHGYNRSAYVPGGATAAVAKEIQDLGSGRTATPVDTGGSSGSSSTWKDIGIVALGAIALMLLLGALLASRKDKPTARTA